MFEDDDGVDCEYIVSVDQWDVHSGYETINCIGVASGYGEYTLEVA